MSAIFISHSSRDNAAALELKTRLDAQGHRSVFLDLDPEKGIQAGVSWERTLYTKLRACRAVVVLCTESYLASQWCFAEIALARMEGKHVFVLLADPWSEHTKLPSILTEEQFMDLRSDPEDAYRRLWNGFQIKGITPQEHREWGPEDPPYPGLRAFEERDAPIFFGRDEEVREGVELLNRARRQGFPRLIMVLGSSGSGKSSLARAGLVPQLRRDRNQWLVPVPFRPGPEPLRELAASLSRAYGDAGEERSWETIHHELLAWKRPASNHIAVQEGGASSPDSTDGSARARLIAAMDALEAELAGADATVSASLRHVKEFLNTVESNPTLPTHKQRPTGTGNALVELASRLRLLGDPSTARVTLVIDQFEELLGYDEADHPANHFLELLREALEVENSPLLALGTMRSDYLGVFQRCAPLIGIEFKSLSVGPMSKDGMRQVIERPAHLGQIQLENGLTERLLNDTGTSDALPLLAFLLHVMWERYRQDRLLEIREYEELGGLQGAIAQVADETLEAALTLGKENDLRDVFLRLARPTEEGTGWARKPLRWDQVSEAIHPMVQHFVNGRLLVRREDDTVEIAHESLFRSWVKLRDWLSENAEGLHLLREIHNDATKWEQAQSEEAKEAYIWRGGRLAHALDLRQDGVLVLEDVGKAFIEASESAEQARIEGEAARQQREREALETRAKEHKQRAEEQTLYAAKLRRRGIAATAVGIVAIVASVFAWIQMDLAKTGQLLALSRQLALVANGELRQGKLQHALLFGAAAYRATDTEEAGNSLQRVLAAQPKLLTFLSDHQGPVHSVAFSPDRRTLASGSTDGSVILWDVTTGNPLREPLTGHQGPVHSVAFSPPDGTTLAAGGEDGSVRLWDLTKDDPQGKPLTGHNEPVYGVAFSPDGTRLASGGRDKAVTLWDLTEDDPQGKPLTGHQDPVLSVAFSPLDDKRLVSGDMDGSVVLWDLTEDDPQGKPLTGHLTRVWSIAFSPDGKRLAAGGEDGSVVLWNVATRKPLRKPLREHKERVTSVAFSSDGTVLASGSRDKAVILWDVATGKPLGKPLTGHLKRVLSVAFSPDGKRLAAGGMDGSVIRWDVKLENNKFLFRKACAIANRNLTHEEWERYVGIGIQYEASCPKLPVPKN